MRYENRVRFERETVSLMISMYCRAVHRNPSLCSECTQLQRYAFARIEKCVLHPNKPVCSECKIHCYKPLMRAQIRQVMRFAGPRMLTRHPLRALRYLWLKLVVSRRTEPVMNNLRS